MNTVDTMRSQDIDPSPAPPVRETPFISDGFARAASPIAPAPGQRTLEFNTPFLSEYGLDGASTVGGPRAELFASFMAELHDAEFEGAVTDLVNEAAALAQDRYSHEGGDAASDRQATLRDLREMLEPLEREAEHVIDRLAMHLGEADYSTLNETELEVFLDRFAPETAAVPPAFEDFLKKWVNKAKRAVTGAVRLAKKGVQLASKLSPVHLILARLKGLVRPLLERVLRFAVDKLPVALRPVARQLAKQFLRIGELESYDEAEDGEQAAADPATITRELDARLAASTLESEDSGRGVEHFAAAEEAASLDAWRRLQRARRRFAREITTVEPEADATPVVEQFVPAILAGLKLGINIIGRPRVINFLSKLVGKLIASYVGPQATPLSQALVDAGLRLAGLEAPADSEELAGEALAATVEDTVNRVVQTAAEAAWQNEAVLDGYVRDAFARAASAHFPDSLIRSDLHEASEANGAWELMPRGSSTKLYKKYSRVLEATVTPQIAAALPTFGGDTVHAVLKDQLGVAASAAPRARVHLYEVIAGTTVASIASNEKTVRGLGHTGRGAWSLLHPLTPEAAGALLKEPALGKAVEAKFLADRNVLEVGQRLYYLELPEGAARVSPGSRRTARIGRTKVVLDLPGGVARVKRYYSEADAQALAALLRKRAPLPTVVAALKRGLETRIAALFSGRPTRGLRVIHETVPAESLLPANVALLIRAAGRPIAGLLTRWVLDALTRDLQQRYDALAADIVRAADADADGLTVVITFTRPAFLADLRGLLSGNPAAARMRLSGRQAIPDYTLVVRPGYARS